MSYKLNITKQAQLDFEYHRKTGNKPFLNKIAKLLEELTETPYKGIGKPEQLKHNFSGLWSRRINGEHRIIYEVMKDLVVIYKARGHYK